LEIYLEKKFELRYFEMNKYGIATPTAILTLLEETAAEHSYKIDYSLYRLERQNIGWVLISGIIDMIRYPKYKEKITIRTWISKYTLVKGYRENIIYDESGAVIGRAKGVWVFYDIEKKKPVPIFDEIKSKWGSNSEISQEVDIDKIEVINDGENQLEYDIYKSDVDSNNHVNNIRYFHWLIESLPDDILDKYILKKINAKFYSEAKYGEKIQVYKKNDLEPNIYLYTMRSNLSNRLLAAAHTVWEKMEI
jgi:acyl-ACP thioesterase